MRKAWPLLTLGIIAYAVFAVVTLPAGVVLRRFESAGVSADGVSGTIWNGAAQVLRLGGAHLGSVRWDLHALALFTGRLTADVDLKRTDGFAKTLVSITPSGRLDFEDLTASLPLSTLPQNVGLGGWGGKANLKFAALSVEDGWPALADGTLEAVDLSSPKLGGALGSYKVVFPPDATAGDTLAGALSDLGGPLQVTGTVQLKKDRSYLIQGLVATRADAPQKLTKSLEVLGPPDDEGRRQFGTEGTL